jgi:DNA-binding beta-propeller fold protein YncE
MRLITRSPAAALASIVIGTLGTLGCDSQTRARATVPTATLATGVRHYEYVFPDRQMFVYDIDHGFRLVRQVALPGVRGIRGVAFSPRTHLLYISHGGDGGFNGNGSLLAYNLLDGRAVWDHRFEFGIDSMAISRDGARIYMPDGELADNGMWYVLDAHSGNVIGKIEGGTGPHNTLVGLSGRHVYLGGRYTPFLGVASTATGRVIKQIGPLRSGVRPFTINGRETLAYTTATGFLGFQVSSIETGRVLYTVPFGPRFTWDPARFGPSAPSHGISLSPDERQLWVLDAPNSYVHAFDVSRGPHGRPRRIADIKLSDRLTGEESGCSYDCQRDGWLQHSRSGCFVFVGDSGDVLSTLTFKPVAFLPALRDTRKMLEIDWRDGVPTSTSSRTGLGYVQRERRPAPPKCP